MDIFGMQRHPHKVRFTMSHRQEQIGKILHTLRKIIRKYKQVIEEILIVGLIFKDNKTKGIITEFLAFKKQKKLNSWRQKQASAKVELKDEFVLIEKKLNFTHRFS